jgi:hypothetical protein
MQVTCNSVFGRCCDLCYEYIKIRVIGDRGRVGRGAKKRGKYLNRGNPSHLQAQCHLEDELHGPFLNPVLCPPSIYLT